MEGQKGRWILASVYAAEKGVTREAIYKKIKRGELRSKHEDGRVWVWVEGEEASLEKLLEAAQEGNLTAARVYESLMRAGYYQEIAAKTRKERELYDRAYLDAKAVGEIVKGTVFDLVRLLLAIGYEGMQQYCRDDAAYRQFLDKLAKRIEVSLRNRLRGDTGEVGFSELDELEAELQAEDASEFGGGEAEAEG
ncbi:MAG TPA: hypothetical protein VKV18_01075 [Chthonomonas sp.]|uniref:acylphosphatase n=1 Tax=Chthonomonas sp. TaxID=2282153 RepID=UPI002B4B2C41|nr:hypothetical protein [Chthonomonas sp.]HLI47271.1 hypothetical protein [Chthonomonas sp.]